MDIQDLGTIGELIGSIFVLVTLVYLAIQVRQSRHLIEENRKIALSQVYQARAFYRGNLVSSFMDNPRFASIWINLRGGNIGPVSTAELIDNFDTLSLEEKAIASFQQQAVTQGVDNTLYQIELGLVDNEGAQSALEQIRREYPLWVHAGISIPPRIRNWYTTNVDEA